MRHVIGKALLLTGLAAIQCHAHGPRFSPAGHGPRLLLARLPQTLDPQTSDQTPDSQAPDPAQTDPAQQAEKRPQARTQAEYKDYNTAYAVAGGVAMEKAANDFAARYPESELRSYLYSKAMREYQNENNPGKMLAMGEKVLALDPNNPIALVLTATVLADSLSDADQDREQKIAEIRKNANQSLAAGASFTPPAGSTPEQAAVYKGILESMAHSALGIMELKTGEDAAAETSLKAAVGLNATDPDPYVWYHLALAQDHQKKYLEALASVKQALQHVGSNADLQRLAEVERVRLARLAAPPPERPTAGRPQNPQM